LAKRQAQLCQGAEAKLAGVWDAERKAAVSRTFLATGKPYAAHTVRTIELALDGYAKDWVTKDAETCAAALRGESRELLNLRTECLSQRRDELKALVDVFAIDGKVLAQAVQAAQSLTPLDSCANATALKPLVL